MKNISVNIRMDQDLKKKFEMFCDDIGMTMTTAFNIFARQTVREQRIPFEIGTYAPNVETLAAIQEVQEMRKHPEQGKFYTDVDQMMEELLSDAI